MKKLNILIYALFFLGIGTVRAQYNVLLSFNGTHNGNPSGSLTLSGSILYGMTSNGGPNGFGNIFSININGSGYTDLFDFTGTNGAQPQGALALSGNVLYGMTNFGGANDSGVIFSINTNGSGYTILLDFGMTNGYQPCSSLTVSGNMLYGTTAEGGVNNDGCIFSLNINGTGYKDLYDFNGNNGNPNGSLTLSGGVLYGMTNSAGGLGLGNIFSINANGSGYKDLFDFNGTNGSYPLGSLTLSGNMLYGMTQDGGANDIGIIFSLDTNGNTYTDLLDFNGTNGEFSYGSLAISGSVLYGMASVGGGYHDGIIFSINTNGSGFTDLLDCDGANGENPTGSLTLSGSVMYGIMPNGGPTGDGTIFSINTNGSGYTDLHDSNGTGNGAYPGSALTLSGSVLYGMAQQGGMYNDGCIFSIDTNGSGYRDLLNFNGTNGIYPEGSLTLSGSALYGMTGSGGANNMGCIFSIDTNGSGYIDLLDFNGTNGARPGSTGSLTISGSVLYGMTISGGTHDSGLIFSINTNGSGYTDLFDFNMTSGTNPDGSLTLSGSMLYGMTFQGGANGYGTIFSINTNGTGYTDMLDFNGTTNGGLPYGSLMLSGSVLYGMSSGGGIYRDGNIFSINTNGSGFKDLMDFNGTDGYIPYDGLTLSGSVLYGVTNVGGGTGGNPGVGNIFSIDTNGNGFYNLFDFTPAYGSQPSGTLTLSGSVLYGTTPLAGIGSGVIFSFKLGCANTYNEPLCIVTIDTATNKSKVIWGRTNSPPATGSYNIYRDSSSVYKLVHTQSLDSLTEYIDPTSKPSAGPVSYKLSTLDSCGESALSAPHTSIYLTTSAGYNVYVLSWTPYIGFTPSKYRIFRGPAMNALVQIDSVPNTVFTYRDTLPPIGSYYVLEAVNPSAACIPTTHSPRNLKTPLLSGSFSNGFNTGILTGIKNTGATPINLTVYPNPNNGMFTIQSSVISGQCSVMVYNELGQEVYNKTNGGKINEQLNFTNQADGIYTLRLITDSGISVQKVVLIRSR